MSKAKELLSQLGEADAKGLEKILKELASGKDAPEKFTPDQMKKLKKAFSTIKTIDPSAPYYERMVKLLDVMSKGMLQQLVDEKIPFLKSLAKNRLMDK